MCCCLSFSSVDAPAFSILIEMGNLCSKSLIEIPLFSGLFPFMCRPGLGTFFNPWIYFVLSSKDTVSSTIITYFGYTYHRSISGQRFERVTFLKWYMCVPMSTIFSKFLDSFNRLEFVEVFIFVSSSLTKLMHFSQALFSPAHIYGAICIVLVIEQPG